MMDDFVLEKSYLVAQTIETGMNSSFYFPNDDNVRDSVLYSLLGLCMIVLVVMLPLNVHVLRLLVKDASNGVTSEFFFLNLCVCEIINSINSFICVFNIILNRNELYSPLYYTTTFLSCMHSISRPFFQFCVCVERYVAVIHPVIFLKYKPLRYRTTLSVAAWIMVLGVSVFCSFLQIRCIFYYILLPEYLFVFSVKILCSIAVLKALRKPGPGEKLSANDAESNRMKKKAFWVILIFLISMLITYFPMMILIFVYDYLSNIQKSVCTLVFSYFLVFSRFVPPCLYLHKIGKLPFISGSCSNYSE